MDLEKAALFYNVEASRRITDNLKVSLEARFFINFQDEDPLFDARHDDYVQVELAYYF